MGVRIRRPGFWMVVEWIYRWGTLVVALALLGVAVYADMALARVGDKRPYLLYVVVLSLLLIHLSDAFKWSRRVSTVLSVVSWIWTLFGLLFACYWVLYRSPPS